MITVRWLDGSYTRAQLARGWIFKKYATIEWRDRQPGKYADNLEYYDSRSAGWYYVGTEYRVDGLQMLLDRARDRAKYEDELARQEAQWLARPRSKWWPTEQEDLGTGSWLWPV